MVVGVDITITVQRLVLWLLRLVARIRVGTAFSPNFLIKDIFVISDIMVDVFTNRMPNSKSLEILFNLTYMPQPLHVLLRRRKYINHKGTVQNLQVGVFEM